MARVRKGSTTPIRAPRFSKRFAARWTAASTSSSTAMPRPASSRRPMRSSRMGFRMLEIEPGDVLRRQAHGVAIVGLRQLAHHQRGVGDGAGHRPGDAARNRADRSARGRGSASARRCRTSRPAAGSSRRCRCRCGAARSRPPPPRRRRPRSRRGSSSGPTGCGSADGSSTARTTACRNPASSSWRR